MQVGHGGYFVLGQSAWAGATYCETDIIQKNEETPVSFITDIGMVRKQIGLDIKKKVKTNTNMGDQLTNIVRYIAELAKEINFHSEQLWLDELPETIYVEELRQKYNESAKKNIISPIIGEYDDPNNQHQGLVKLNLTKEGNAVIFGNATSGKETLLATLIYDIITTHTVDETQLYLMDFGTESLKIFKKSSHVGDIVFMNDAEKIERLLKMLQEEIKTRTAILSDYNGSIDVYRQKTGKNLPTIITIINSFEVFNEVYSMKYDDLIQTLTRDGKKCGIVFIMTVSNAADIRYRLNQNFKQKIVLQMNDDDEFIRILDKVGNKRPANIFGRGLIRIGEEIFEFQTAKICEADKWNDYIQGRIEQLNKTNNIVAESIKVLPETVTIEHVKNELKDITSIPIGISDKTLKVVKYDFTKQMIDIITAKNTDLVVNYTTGLIEELQKLKDIKLIILDGEKTIQKRKDDLENDYKTLLKEIEKKEKNMIAIIIGIESFINVLGDKNKFLELLKKCEELENFSFVIVDNVAKIKGCQYDSWYKEYITGDTGIWVGNGINDQYLLSVNSSGKRINSECGQSYGYLVWQGKPTCIKLLGMNEEGEDDE